MRKIPRVGHIGFWVRLIADQMAADLRRRTGALGFKVSEWTLLQAVARAEEMTGAELVRRTGMSKALVSLLVEELENRALIQRVETLDDRRRLPIQLSFLGRELMPELDRVADENEARFFGGLSLECRAAVLSTVRD